MPAVERERIMGALPRKSKDFLTTYYSREERLLALLIALVLVGLGLLVDRLTGVVWEIVGAILFIGACTCFWIFLWGEMSYD